MKIYQVLSSIGLDDVGIYLRNGPFASDKGMVNLHSFKGTHWVCFINENFFDSYGYSPPNKLSKIIIKRNGYCLYFENHIQRKDSFVLVFVYM